MTALTLGSSYPLFYNARIRPSDATGRFVRGPSSSHSSPSADDLHFFLQRAETELEYSDSVTLAITTGLVINFPRPRFAVLPISLGVTLVGLHGTVRRRDLHLSTPAPLMPSFPCALTPPDDHRTSLLSDVARLADAASVASAVAAPGL